MILKAIFTGDIILGWRLFHQIEEVVRISSGIIPADKSTLHLTVAHLKGIYIFSLAWMLIISFFLLPFFCSFTTVRLTETSFYLA